MHCFVYASQRKADCYLWLPRRDDFSSLPESLILMLGDLRPVLEVELSGDRQLPNEDAQQIGSHTRYFRWIDGR